MQKLNAMQKAALKLAKGYKFATSPACKLVAVRNGTMTATGLAVRIDTPCDLPDGLYSPSVLELASALGTTPQRYDTPMEEYPFSHLACPDTPPQLVTIPPEGMETLRKVLPAVAVKDVRYYLNGALFELESGHVVATDGCRLHRAPVFTADGSGSVIVPDTLLKFLAKEKTCIMAFYEGLIRATLIDGTTVSANPVDGRYPNYERVIPTRDKSVDAAGLTVCKTNGVKYIVKALEKGSKSPSVRVEFFAPHKLRVVKEYDAPGIVLPFEGALAVNARYLINAVEALELSSACVFFGGSATESIYFTDGRGMQVVVMPLRV